MENQDNHMHYSKVLRAEEIKYILMQVRQRH